MLLKYGDKEYVHNHRTEILDDQKRYHDLTGKSYPHYNLEKYPPDHNNYAEWHQSLKAAIKKLENQQNKPFKLV